MAENLIEKLSFKFATRVVRAARFLVESKHELIMSRQFLRSGTSIGANVSEALCAQSRADFVTKLHIALKEANESLYWLRLLGETEYLTSAQRDSLLDDCDHIVRVLNKIIFSTKAAVSEGN